MLSLVRLFGSLIFSAVLLSLSGMAAMADGSGHHSRAEITLVEPLLVVDQVEQLSANPADCDGNGTNSCCSQTCGSASCPIGAFPVPATHVFAAPRRIAFSEARGRLLTQRTLFGLLRPPRADLI